MDRKWLSIAIYLCLVAVSVAAYVHYSIAGTVRIFESDISASPSIFSVDLAKGTEYVKQITVKNNGSSQRTIYFEDVVEGPTPDKISVSFKNTLGESIYSSKKLTLDAKSEAKVNVHIDVKSDAEDGSYKIYIFVKES
ncbi:MAG: hypothetical protein QXE86_05525 [Archaeoglobaceae archaeon]